MRYVCPAAAIAALTVSFLSVSPANGQGNQGLSIGNYQYTGETRVSLTQFAVSYKADLTNTGVARTMVGAMVQSPTPNVVVQTGQNILTFSPVAAGGTVTSSNTFTIILDRTVSFDVTTLQWTFLVPVANAGTPQTVPIGTTVTLNGSASTNPSGAGTLTYNWAFTARPVGSNATLSNANSVQPTFKVDIAGNYTIALTVSNGYSTDVASVTVSTVNSPPVANAGPNQTVAVGATVHLDGSGSTDIDGDPLTYSWVFTPTGLPAGSTAMLINANTVSPYFVVDKYGTYVVQLTVNDGHGNSNSATVTISTSITPPVANAGPAQNGIAIGALVQLDGSGSTDVDGFQLTYAWVLNSGPANTKATPSNPNAVKPTFTADLPGQYVWQLTVNDGHGNSNSSTVTISTNPAVAPTANAGQNQTVAHNATVQLSGSGTDPQGLSLTYSWSLSKPSGSQAVLSNAAIANPTFVADVPGQFVAQLIVSNGFVQSQPSTVTITTTTTPPVANAGQNQSVSPGAVVTLDGSGSTDVDHDPITYSWKFLSVPDPNNPPTLNNPTSVSPTFVANLAGVYVIQLTVSDPYASSQPVTVTVTAGTASITLSPKPLNITTSTGGTLTVSLGMVAGPGGQVVNLLSLDTTIADAPATVTIPQGQTGVNTTITPGGSLGTTTIYANASGFTGDNVTVNSVTPAGITLSVASSSVGVTHTINGTITLSAAPASSVVVALSANPTGIVTVQPPSVTIPAGSTTGTFTVTGVAVGSTTITGTATGYTNGTVSVGAAMLGQITLPTNVTIGLNSPTTYPVTIATGAPVGGVTVTLSSDNTSNVTISPSTVFIAAGQFVPSTQPQVTGVGLGSANISASAGGFFGDKEAVQVVATLSFTQQNVTVGVNGSASLTLNLSGPAPAGGLTVNISSSNTSVATVPQTVTFQPNLTTVTIPVSALATGTATIHASATNLADVTATVTVVSFGAITLPTNPTALLGQTTPFPVSLPQAAPAGGVTVSLGSTDTSKLTISPATISIAAGQTTPTTQPTVTGVNIGTASINASAPGYGSSSVPVPVTATVTFSPTSITINGAGTQNFTLTLSANAPASGVTVNLSSSNTGVATVPATATFASGQNTTSVVVTGVGAGSAVIHASNGSYIPDATGGVTVQSAGAIGLPANTNVALGGNATFTVTLPSAPTSNVTVNLSSSDTTKVTLVSSSVTVLAGQTTASAQVTGVNIGSANITASAGGYTSASAPVQVNATVSFSPSGGLTIVGTATQNFTLTLSANAPAAGVLVNLSSSNTGVATVPANVTFSGGTNTVSVPVTGVAPGAAVIHASNSTNIPDTTGNVTVQAPGSIILPTNPTLTLGGNAAFTVTLANPAASAFSMTLASSDTTKVTISPTTINFSAGATTPQTQPSITGVGLGSATITASATGYSQATSTVQVGATLTFAQPNVTISGIVTQNVPLNLSANAPTGGLTVNLNSSNTAIVTVPSSVTIAAGTSTVNVPVTAVALGGPVTITASTAAPNVPNATTSVTVQSAGSILLPANTPVALGNSATLTVTLPSAPPANVTVNLSSSDTTKVTLASGTVTVLAGQTTASAQVNGVNIGSANITASATGYGSSSGAVAVNATVSFTQQTLTVPVNTTQNLTLTLSATAPAAGVTVNVSSNNTAVATVPATVQFTGGTNSVSVPVFGVAAGQATISASNLPNIPAATSTVTVQAPGTFVLPSNATVGLGGTATFAVGLGAPAPTTVTVSLASTDTSKLTISPSSVTITAGNTAPATQPTITGVNLGSASITASGTGYTQASATVQIGATLTFGTQNLVVPGLVTQNVQLTLSGVTPTGLSVTLTSSNTSIATVPATVSIPAGSNGVTVPVTGVALGGPVTITASATPNVPNATTSATVVSAGAIGLPASTPVALGGTASLTVTLPAAPASNVTVTLSSSDTTKVTLASGSVTVPAGQTSASALVNGVNIGSATITANAPGYTSGSGAVTVGATLNFAPQNLTITGFNTQNLTLILSANAPTGGLTVNLSSSSANATVASTATFAAGTNSVQVPVTGAGVGSAVIHASLTPNIPDTTANITVQSAGTIGVPATLSVALGGTAALNITLPQAAPAGGVTVALLSSDTTKATVPASVSIPGGATSPTTQPLVTGINLGTGASITVSAPGYTSGSTAITVTGSINFAQSSATITGFTTQNLTLQLSGPAPAGGIAVNVSSSNTAVATVPAIVTFAAATTSVSVPVTTVAMGSAVIHASNANLADTTESLTVVLAGAIGLPSGTSVQLGGSATFAISLPVPAPAGGVTVTLVSSDTSKVLAPSTVTVPGGATTPTTQPQVSGINVGSATITASAPGYTTATSGAVQVFASVNFTATTVTMPAFTTQNLTLNLSAPAPAGGITVAIGSSNTAVATVPTSVTFLQNQTAVSVPVTTLAVGSSVIDASGTNIPDTTVTVNVQNISLGTLTVTSANVGNNLEAEVNITLSPAPLNGLVVTLTSGDPTKLLLGQSTKTAGAATVQFNVPAGVGIVSAYAQGLVNSGTVSMTATALGWTSGANQATLYPSGFVLAGPTGQLGNVVPTFPTNVTDSTTLTISSARLNAQMQFAELQQVSGAVSTPVAVPITSSNTTYGTVSPTSVSFNGGDSSYTTQFNALAVGSPSITLGVPTAPTGFSQPSDGSNTLIANISAAGLSATNTTVGQGLEATATIQLNGVSSSNTTVTVSTNDATKLLLAANPGDLGSTSIILQIKAGFTFSPQFYVYGLVTSGSATYTASAGGFGTATGTVNMAPSGIVINGPSGFGVPISTTILSSPSALTVSSAMLDASNNFVATQALAGNAAGGVSVNVTSSNTAVGTITVSPVTIPSGSFSVATQFQPAGNGTTTISVNQPLSATPAQDTTVSATVATTGIGASTDNSSLGQFLETQGTFFLGAAAPTGGVTVTLTSNNPSLLLSTSPTTAGSSSISFHLNAGEVGTESNSSGNFKYAFYPQGLNSSGTATITITASGYVTHNSAINLTPSGVVVWDGLNVGDTLVAPSGGSSTPVSISMAQLDSGNNFMAIQQLAPGLTVTANLGVTGTGTLTPSQVTIQPGADTVITQFSSLTTGSGTIGFTSVLPAVFSTPAQGATLGVFIY